MLKALLWKTINESKTIARGRSRNTAKIPEALVNQKQREPSFSDMLKNTFNLPQVRKTVWLGSEIFSAIHPFIEKPTWWSGAKALVGVGKALVDDVEVWSHTFFDGNEWTRPYSKDFNQTIINVLSHFPFQTIKTAEEHCVIQIVDMGGVKASWALNTKLNIVDNVYVETDKVDMAREIIKKLLWNQFKGTSLVMRSNKRISLSSDEPRIVFEVDDAFHPLPSQRASEYSVYLQKCIDAGVPRSIMLYGPPGTGKSTMARTIVENLKLRSFRIRVEDVSGLENSTLFEAISIFEPDAVILDDFDRAHAQVALLETLEFFQRHVKLVVSTVNDKENLDEALLRPGRFDELVLVDKMDETVIKHVLGEFSDGFETVKDWPVAFIIEYTKRRKFMSAQEAAEGTVELANRVRRLDMYRAENEVERMLGGKRRKGYLKHDVAGEIDVLPELKK